MPESISIPDAPFQIRGGTLFTLNVLELKNLDLKKIDRELLSVVRQAPKFFENAPIVIDCHLISPELSPNFDDLIEIFRKHHLILVGIRGGSEKQQQSAKKSGLPVLNNPKSSDTPSLTKRTSPQKEAIQAPKKPLKMETELEEAQTTKSGDLKANTSIMITKPVRSGQQISAPNGDLIIIGSVSRGAELLASGSIHVYGTLRGRALAGIKGNTQARIFCHHMDAELISIAGSYIVYDGAKNPPQGNVQIYLEGGKLKMLPFLTPA